MGQAEDAAGMARYVKQQNEPSTQRNPAFDDLKIVKGPAPSANTRSTRAGTGPGPTTRARSNAPNPQDSRQNASRTLQDTDASLTTTTGGSTSRAHSAGDKNRRHHENAPSQTRPDEEFNDDEFELVTDNDGSDEADDEQELPDHPAQGTKPKRSTKTRLEAPQVKPDGRNLGRMSGDTYPETTSGRPSTTHDDDHHELQAAAYPQAHNVQPMAMPERGAGTRLSSHPAQNMQQMSHVHNGQQGHYMPQQPIVPPPRFEDILSAVNSGFSYAAPASNKMQSNRPQPAQPTQQPSSHHHSTKPMPASTTHRGLSTSGNQIPVKEVRRREPSQHSRPEPQYTPPEPVPQDIRTHQPESTRRYATPPPQHPRLPPPQQQQRQYRRHSDKTPPVQVAEALESEMMSEVGDRNNNNMPRESSVEPQHQPNETVQLDHYPPQLYGLTYDGLKAASFDADPNAVDPVNLSALQPNDPLPKKLDALVSMDVRAKQEYFESLGIQEWEEAGDWFLESFAKLTDKFKILRQEKRKMAREFEDEVEKRHESVSKKQKLTAGAMNEMKESGGKVLQGTPKKDAKKMK